MTNPAALQPADSFEWYRVVRSIHFGTRDVGPRRVSEPYVMAICGALALCADPDGSNVFPSIGRLALETGMSYPAAKAVMRLLRELGLIEQVARGGGRSGASAKHRLTLPDDLLSRVKFRSPSESAALVKKITRESTGRD